MERSIYDWRARGSNPGRGGKAEGGGVAQVPPAMGSFLEEEPPDDFLDFFPAVGAAAGDGWLEAHAELEPDDVECAAGDHRSDLPLLPWSDEEGEDAPRVTPKRKRVSINWAEKLGGGWQPAEDAKPAALLSPEPVAMPSTREERNAFNKKARDSWIRDWIQAKGNEHCYFRKNATFREKRALAYNEWTQMDVDQQHEIYKGYYVSEEAAKEPPAMGAESESKARSSRMVSHGKDRGRSGVLLTWNPPVMQSPALKNLWTCLQKQDPHSENFAKVCEKIAALPAVIEQWENFKKELTEILDDCEQASETTKSQEVSVHAAEPGRVHYHAMLSTVRQPVKVITKLTGSEWRLLGVNADVQVCGGRGRMAVNSAQRGHAYLQVPKLGSLRFETDYQKYHAFAIKQHWVMNWWTERKLSHDSVRAALLEARGNTARHFAEVAFVENAELEKSCKEEQRQIFRNIQRQQHGFKVYRQIEEWRQQYLPEVSGWLSRFKFLVLEGPSRKGKTELAKSLYGVEATFYTNVQDVSEPNLRGFDRRKHKACILDEATPELVLQNKVLFQATADGVDLSQSKCGQHTYWRLLYARALIVCTNKWVEDGLAETERRDESSDEEVLYKRMSRKDKQWLVANSVHVKITEPTWTP